MAEEVDICATVRAAQKGDRQALARLVSESYPPLLAYLSRLVHDRDVAQDLAQETFIQVMRHLAALAEPASFRTWLLRIATNIARDYWRRPGAREIPGLMTTAAAFGPDGLPAGDRLDPAVLTTDRELVRQLLTRLSPEHRAVLVLRFYEELTLEEVAAVVGVPVGTVKSRLHHALRYLRRGLQVGTAARPAEVRPKGETDANPSSSALGPGKVGLDLV